MHDIFRTSRHASNCLKAIILNLVIFLSGLTLLADTQTATVDFTTVIRTNNVLTFSMDESGYGQNGTDLTHEPQQQTNLANLHVAMMRMDLGYATPGDPNSTIICEAAGASTSITGDQWIDAIKAAGAVPEISVQMNTANSQSTWVIDASNMVEHFNVQATSNRVDRWIIGNEPSNNGLTTNSYAAGFAAIFPAMKAADPTIKVGGPADATYNSLANGEIKMILTIIHKDGLTPDFVDYHSYGSHSDSDAALMASTVGQYQGDPVNLRSFLIGLWGSSVGGAMPIQIGEWNLSGTTDSRMLENYGSVWSASAVGNMLDGGVSVMQQYADKNEVLGSLCETANESATSPSSVTYNSNINDPEPIYHGIGMFTGENLFQEFGSEVVQCTSSTTNIEVYASDNPQNIVAINKTPGTTSSVTFTLTGLSSGTLTVWQKNSGGNLGNYSTNVPVKLGTVSVSGGSFTYSLPAYSVTTFVYTNAGTPPAITTQPQSQTVSQGNNVTFSVTATGTAPLSYQWQFKSANISGATSSSYTLDDVQSGNAGNYSVVITNNYGRVTSSNAVLTVNTNASEGQNLLLNFNTPGQYTGNFNNPGTASPCTETNAGGVTNSGAILVTGADGNATYNAGTWDFSTNTAWINVSMMVKIQQATSTADKIQLGLVNSSTAGFATAAAGDGWNFGSFRLLPQSTTAPTYQLAYQTATNGTTSSANAGSVVTLTVGHWYQFNTYFTNTGPGTSYNIACSLIDYGTNGATQGTNVFTFSTVESITGTQAALSSDNAVCPCFRVADDTGASVLDNFTVTSSNAGGGGSTLQTLWLNFDTPNQYLTNFDNPGPGGSPCTETNAGGVTNSGALIVTAVDSNATYTNASWNFSTNNATISVSMMMEIQQATGTGDKIQLGLVNSTTAGFANAAADDGWIFGSFRLLPQSTTAAMYQLQYQTATNGTTSDANVGSVITLTAGHWYQYGTYFTNTGPGTSYNMACSLIDYGTSGATEGTNMLTFSTLETITGTQAALSSDNTVFPAFRVAADTGASVLDDFAVNITGSGGLPAVMTSPLLVGSAAPQFGTPTLVNGQLTLTWSNGGQSSKALQASVATLLTATNLSGPWTVVTNTSSPYTTSINPGISQQFFQLKP
jgi:Immunoglobulin domain